MLSKKNSSWLNYMRPNTANWTYLVIDFFSRCICYKKLEKYERHVIAKANWLVIVGQRIFTRTWITLGDASNYIIQILRRDNFPVCGSYDASPATTAAMGVCLFYVGRSNGIYGIRSSCHSRGSNTLFSGYLRDVNASNDVLLRARITNTSSIIYAEVTRCE